MLTKEQAAKYLVVGWCKDWSLDLLLYTLCEVPIGTEDRPDKDALIAAAHAEYGWMPETRFAFHKGNKVRRFVGGFFPKLSKWFFDQSDDVSRLRCAQQVQSLKCPAKPHALRSVSDQTEMKKVRREARQAQMSYRLSRDSFKSHQRSAWNVCKA